MAKLLITLEDEHGNQNTIIMHAQEETVIDRLFADLSACCRAQPVHDEPAPGKTTYIIQYQDITGIHTQSIRAKDEHDLTALFHRYYTNATLLSYCHRKVAQVT